MLRYLFKGFIVNVIGILTTTIYQEGNGICVENKRFTGSDPQSINLANSSSWWVARWRTADKKTKYICKSRVAGTMVARSSSVRAIARSKLSQVPPLHMHVGK